MKRKFFTFLMAFLTTLSGAVWAQDYTGTIDLSGNGTPQPTGSGISIDENLIEISGDGNYLIKGDGNARDFYIDVHNEPTITLENVNLSHNGDPIMELNYVHYFTFILKIVCI